MAVDGSLKKFQKSSASALNLVTFPKNEKMPKKVKLRDGRGVKVRCTYAGADQERRWWAAPSPCSRWDWQSRLAAARRTRVRSEECRAGAHCGRSSLRLKGQQIVIIADIKQFIFRIEQRAKVFW